MAVRSRWALSQPGGDGLTLTAGSACPPSSRSSRVALLWEAAWPALVAPQGPWVVWVNLLLTERLTQHCLAGGSAGCAHPHL